MNGRDRVEISLPGQSAVATSGIADGFSRLQDQITFLHESIAAIRTKLSPVLLPEPAEKEGSTGVSSHQKTQSEIASCLEGLGNRVGELIGMAESIRRRVDL